MTELAADRLPLARPWAARIAAIVRLHLGNPFTILLTPLLVIGICLVAFIALWWILDTAAGEEAVTNVSIGMQYSGATTWIFVYMMVVAIMAVNYSFAFALGLGATRRDYYLGSVVTFVGLSAGYSLLFLLLIALERATNGWGFGGVLFTTELFAPREAWWVQGLCVFALFLFFFFAGTLFAAIYVRWRARGVILFFAALALALIAAAVLITAVGGWPTVGGMLVELGVTGAYGLSLVVTAAAAIAGYLLIRRATPRS